MTSESAGRALVAARSHGGRCELCGRAGTNVHHRMRQGRPWNAANLLRVCGSGNVSGCHGWIETHALHATELGLIVPRHRAFEGVPMFCHPVLFDLAWWLPDDDGMWHLSGWIPTPAVDEAMYALNDYLDARRDAE